MRFKTVIFLVVIALIGFCRLSDCNAQSKQALTQNPVIVESQSVLFKDPGLFTQNKSVEDNILIAYSKPTGFGGFEFSLNMQSGEFVDANNIAHQPFAVSSNSTQIRPQITLFSSRANNSKEFKLPVNSSSKLARNDRYKNTIPAIFRLTLKGYSIMEHSNNQTLAWTLNKVDNKDLRKPELMFSFTKKF